MRLTRNLPRRTRNLCWFGWLLVAAATPVAAAGDEGPQLIRRTGQHIRLVTDLENPAEAETLVASFDAAVPQWFDFWGLPPESAARWRVDAYVMRDPAWFRQQGWIPERIPEFPFGYAAGNTLWVVAQRSEYYTRHLLLHEGVHALAFDQFGGAGPSWFMEGTAELLSTHRGEGATVSINALPRTRGEAAYWGRFKAIAQRRATDSIPAIESVMRLPRELNGNVDAYAWSWAAAMLLSRYDDYRPAFMAAARNGRDSGTGFTRQLYRRLAPQWPIVKARWRVLCHELDYGFDWSRERVDLATSDPMWDGRTLRRGVDAARGWQSVGARFPAGTRLSITAGGRCRIAETDGEPWVSEPQGVTLRYHRGRPLGQLLVCVLPCVSDSQPTVQSLEIHGGRGPIELTVADASWVLLRVNDAVGELAENEGGYDVTIQSD